MKNAMAAIVVGAALTILPAAGLATAFAQDKPAAKPTQLKGKAHATTGVVKSINDSTLVITRSGKHAENMTFDMNASTHRYGTLDVGSPVSVRYQDAGKTHVATAITLQRARDKAHTSSSSS